MQSPFQKASSANDPHEGIGCPQFDSPSQKNHCHQRNAQYDIRNKLSVKSFRDAVQTAWLDNIIIVTLKIVRVGCIILSPQSYFAEPLCKTHRCVTVATTLYSGYHYLYRLQQVQLATLSTAGTTTYTVYNRFNQLHCLQLVNHIVHPWSLVALQLNFV